MRKKKVVLDVDSIGNQKEVLTKEEEKAISEYFRKHRVKGKRQKGEKKVV